MNKRGFLRRHAIRIVLSLLVVLPFLMNALGVVDLAFIQSINNYSYDVRLQWTMPNTIDKRIVILDIDEKSLQEQGHWPWPRNKLAHLVDLLFDQYRIDVLGFDMLFAESDESSGLRSLQQLARTEFAGNTNFKLALDKLRPHLDFDQIFADSLKNRRVVLGYYFHHEGRQSGSVGTLPAPSLRRGSFDPHNVEATVASGFSANLPELQISAATSGFYNATPLVDADGVFRRTPLLQMYDGDLYEALAVSVARLALRVPAVELGYEGGEQDPRSLEFLDLGKRRIAVDRDVAALIPYRGKEHSFAYVSASDLLNGKTPLPTLQGAIVLVGTTAPGLMDLRSTPVQEVYPGVEMHANLIAGIIDGNIKEGLAHPVGFEVELLLVIGVLLALALPALSPLRATVLSGALITALTAAYVLTWKSANLVLPLTSSLFMVVVLFVFNMAYGYFVESRGKRMLTSLFGQYVPPELVDEMAKDPGAYTLAGESREMTVLFADVRGFTTISEGLAPAQLTQLMNEFLTPMTQVIHQHRGTIDKYMGDAIMAFWGAPVPDGQHARHALLAAMDMMTGLEALQDQFKARGWPPIKIGVGLNSGEMTVGNMGSEFRLAYTVMGDAVNLGSRLEGLTKEYGVPIIVSEYTRDAVPDFLFRELDRVRVKGKDRPIGIYQPICLVTQCSATDMEELDVYGTALRLYREQNWLAAEEKFVDLQRRFPGHILYRLYARRIEFFREHSPAADWDGTFVFTTK
ncbi:MAG: adenylate/guanylate cyclase domain-containing protein [Comamonadaceae bacterium]